MDAQKLAKVLAMAASDNEAEALHALRTAKRLLDGHGVDFVEVARRVADAHPAAAGSSRAQVEDLEDAIFDLRNEIRHLRAENERLKQGRAAAPPAAEPASFADAARDAAAAIRLRAELAEARDRIELLENDVLALKAHEAQAREHLKQEMAEAGRMATRVEDLESRRLRLEAENRRLSIDGQSLAAQLAEARERLAELSARLLASETRIAMDVRARKPGSRAKAKASASQYALL